MAKIYTAVLSELVDDRHVDYLLSHYDDDDYVIDHNDAGYRTIILTAPKKDDKYQGDINFEFIPKTSYDPKDYDDYKKYSHTISISDQALLCQIENKNTFDDLASSGLSVSNNHIKLLPTIYTPLSHNECKKKTLA